MYHLLSGRRPPDSLVRSSCITCSQVRRPSIHLLGTSASHFGSQVQFATQIHFVRSSPLTYSQVVALDHLLVDQSPLTYSHCVYCRPRSLVRFSSPLTMLSGRRPRSLVRSSASHLLIRSSHLDQLVRSIASHLLSLCLLSPSITC